MKYLQHEPSGNPSGKANLDPHSLVLEVYTKPKDTWGGDTPTMSTTLITLKLANKIFVFTVANFIIHFII